MIRCIAAIDNKRGLANDHGIPWDLPTDRAYYRQKTAGSTVLMGFNTYLEFDKPWEGRRNLVAIDSNEILREGFERIDDARDFLKNFHEDVWVIGGGNFRACSRIALRIPDSSVLSLWC